MNIDYLVYNPCGNITLLVTTPAERKLRPVIAAELMKKEPHAEQVGFLTKSGLSMAGGEFCGNATMCAAAYFLSRTLKIGAKKNKTLYVSGAGRITVSMERKSETVFSGAVNMPKPVDITEIELPMDSGAISLTTVRFKGISHIIYKGKMEKADAERYIKQWCDVLSCDALGIMFIEKNRLTPLVYVPGAGTLVWESSCASGTTAAGIYESAAGTLWFDEPAGKLGVSVKDGVPVLYGTVELLEGKYLRFDNLSYM